MNRQASTLGEVACQLHPWYIHGSGQLPHHRVLVQGQGRAAALLSQTSRAAPNSGRAVRRQHCRLSRCPVCCWLPVVGAMLCVLRLSACRCMMQSSDPVFATTMGELIAIHPVMLGCLLVS